MTIEQTQWQAHADKIFEMLQDSPESRVQAYVLLDALVDSAASAGAASAFNKIFAGLDTVHGTFAWMSEIEDKFRYNWSQREAFEKEGLFIPLFEMWLRLYPDKAMNLPRHMVFGRLPRIPDFLKKPHSITSITFNSRKMDVSGLEEVYGLSTIQVNVPKHYLSGLPSVHSFAVKRSNPLHVWTPDGVLVLEMQGEICSVLIATGCFSENLSISDMFDSKWLDKNYQLHHFQAVTPYLFEADILSDTLWSQRTPHDFLDLGFCRLTLNEQVDQTIAERLVAIHFIHKRLGFDSFGIGDLHTGDYILDIFEEVSFPLLKTITMEVDSYRNGSYISLSVDFLQRCPKLETLYCQADHDIELLICRESSFWSLVHPLSNVFLRCGEEVVLYGFNAEYTAPLNERLTTVSETAEHFLALPLESFVNLEYLHLFDAYDDLTDVFELPHSNLQEFCLEQSAYTIAGWADDFIGETAENGVESIREYMKHYPQSLLDRLNRPYQSKGTGGYQVQSLSDLQYCFDTNVSQYRADSDFLRELKDRCETQRFPDTFIQFLKTTGVVRVGGYCLWLKGSRVHMKAYRTWGQAYVDKFRGETDSPVVSSETLNLERAFIGQPNGATDLLPLSVSAMRLNDETVSIEILKSIAGLKRLTVEVASFANGICQLEGLEVLTLSGLGLTELPSDIGALTNLKELHLWGNRLDELPGSLVNLCNLEIINISDNAFTGLPSILFSLPKLEKIICRGASDEWEQVLLNDRTLKLRVEQGELCLHDASNR